MRTTLKRGIISANFALSLIVLFACFQGFALPSYMYETFGEWAQPIEYRSSALSLTLGGIFFGGITLLVPFCASASFALHQVDDVRSNMMMWQLVRCQRRVYFRRNSISAFCCGAISSGGAFCLHAILWNLLAQPYNPVMYPNHEIGFWSESFFSRWAQIGYGLPIYIEIAMGLAFSAGIWSLFALSIAIWIPDKLLVWVIPSITYKLWNANLSFYLFGIWLPSPDTLYNDAQTWRGDASCVIAYIVLAFISLLLYKTGLKRRAFNE